MRHVRSAWLIWTSCAMLVAALALAVTRVAADDADAPSFALGARFESQSAGISLCPPANLRLVNRFGDNSIAEWSDEPKRTWRLVLSQSVSANPIPLVTGPDNFGKETVGLLETTVDVHKGQYPGVLILRQDLTNIADGGVPDPHNASIKKPNVGLIVMRYTNGGVRYLTQQALIQANSHVYYILTLTTPGGKGLQADSPIEPIEKEAVGAFSAMLDQVRLTDRGVIRAEQEERLDHTRNLLVNINSRAMHAALVSEQWLRIIRDGKDIGYTYITEDPAASIPPKLTEAQVKEHKSVRDLIRPGDGVLIGMRARLIQDGTRSDKSKGPIQTDSASWFFVSGDLKHEDWSRLIVTDDHVNPSPSRLDEIGTSDKRQINKIVMADPKKPGALPVGKRPEPFLLPMDDYELDVTLLTNKENGQPVQRKVSPWYIPQAIVQLLPRLLPRKVNEPKKYMFASYVSEPTRQVMQRYVDVLPSARVPFNNQFVQAVQIRERLGLDGPITTHYISNDGTYLGSETPIEKTIVLPTDASTLINIWKDAILRNPDEGADHGPQRAAQRPVEQPTAAR